MKISISNLAWSESEDQSKVIDVLDKYSIDEVEIAKRKLNYDEVLKSGRRVGSMQSIIRPTEYQLFRSDLDRSVLELEILKAISDARNFSCRHIVYGSPSTRRIDESITKSKFARQEEAVIETFQEMSEIAKDVVIGFEPVVARYGSNYANDFIEAAEFVKRVDRDNFRINLDIANLLENQTSFEEIESLMHLVSHVHVSEPDLKKIEYHDIVKKIVEYLRSHDREDVSISIEAVDLSLDEIDESLATVKRYFD